MSYSKNTWSTGDTITAALINNLETQYDEVKAELEKSSGQDIKSNADKVDGYHFRVNNGLLEYSSDGLTWEVAGMKPGTKMYADGAFASATVSGCIAVADGQGYKIVLDDAEAFSYTASSPISDLDNVNDRISQAFTVLAGQTVDKIKVNVFFYSKDGSPGDVTVAIYDDSAGDPGNLLGSTTISAASVTGLNQWVETSEITLSRNMVGEETLHVVLSAAGVDGSNLYNINKGSEGASSPWGKTSTDAGSTWSTDTDHNFCLIVTADSKSGTVTQQISDSSLGEFRNVYHTVAANGGTITIDVEDTSGNDLKAGVTDGQDISDIANPQKYQTFQLKANLSRSAVTDTSPELNWWGISYIGDTAS